MTSCLSCRSRATRRAPAHRGQAVAAKGAPRLDHRCGALVRAPSGLEGRMLRRGRTIECDGSARATASHAQACQSNATTSNPNKGIDLKSHGNCEVVLRWESPKIWGGLDCMGLTGSPSPINRQSLSQLIGQFICAGSSNPSCASFSGGQDHGNHYRH